MSSTIFFKFQSQKLLSKILFDGTGITVFDLKREVIQVYNIATNTEVMLRLYTQDSEEYQDDTVVIPRSSTVIGRLSPARGNLKGNISRYIAGKPRMMKSVNANVASTMAPTTLSARLEVSGDQTEEERINAMFSQQDNQWKEAQETLLALQTYHVNKPQQGQQSDDLPPPGYICYRCGAKDHWIKNCPTNNDPNFEGKRIKRTTGIPKSSLKTIQNPTDLTEEERANMNFMVNDAGEYVIAMADKKSWESYQKRTAAVKKQYDVKDKSMLDPITGSLMENPVVTPCCQKTYSRLSIEDKLVESDFVCPSCGKEDVLLDSLEPNKELDEKIKLFIKQEDAKEPNNKRPLEQQDSGDLKRAKMTLALPARPNMMMPMNNRNGMAPQMMMPIPFPMMFAPGFNNMNHNKK